jgi:hypothetical protein
MGRFKNARVGHLASNKMSSKLSVNHNPEKNIAKWGINKNPSL